uniref:CCHC-type domain-containing protein n=1 Tax=Hordeum vulgare subsp. vulgare TaxID=112509 RepID=A0A8I6XGH1_HORVV
MCINCGCAGHYRSECEAPPRCPTTLSYLGYGTERGSFYFLDAEIEEEAARPHLATATLAPEQPIPDGLVISADIIRDELAAYIGDFRGSEFAWEVSETAPLVFSVPFPSAEILRVCSHGPIRCPINQLMICVQAATAEPDPVPPLEKVWVLVYGLPRGGSVAPRGGKLTHILKAISEHVGKLITADLASFEDDGPARIEILCPAPAEIDGLSLVFYFGYKGRRLTFELESPAPMVPLDPALTGPEPGDGGLDKEGGSSEEGSSSEGDDATVGAPPEPSDCRHNPGPLVAGQSGPARGSTVGTVAPVVAVDMEIPLPASPAPVAAPEEEVSVGLEVCPTSSPRSPGVVCYSRSPGSPPSPTSGSPDPRPPATGDPGWVSESPPVPCSRLGEGASPVVAARQSAQISQSRILQDGRVSTIPELAALRVAARDLFPDSGIVFCGEKGPPLEQISALCAKERLEGALAEARCLAARSNAPLPRCTTNLVIERPGTMVHRQDRTGVCRP